MEIKCLGRIADGGQDGAVQNGYLFRFDHRGICHVYDVSGFSADAPTAYPAVAVFTLDKADCLIPHSNSVMFGKDYYADGDEFPLLYTNVYNNYAAAEDPLSGVTCVYRITRNGTEFFSKLVQLIEVGFTDDPLWSSVGGGDIRPFGNFAIDRERSVYYAFTMRDKEQTTRYFAFDLPAVGDGTPDARFGVNRVVLGKADVKRWFDCPYHRFVQGATYRDGTLYSLEGFTDNAENPPAIRLIDVENGVQRECRLFAEFGLTVEPELIDFENGICYYADHHGNLYELKF